MDNKPIDRICISINNRCNLKCSYCHFREKNEVEDFLEETEKNQEMNVIKIIDNILEYNNHPFKIGFVGNGEPFLNYHKLESYIKHILKNDTKKRISTYTITNGTINLTPKQWEFLKEANTTIGFSLDGYKELHDKNRCNTFEIIMKNLNNYFEVFQKYPTFNATVSQDTILNQEKVIEFFKQFNQRVTFSRLVGENGISIESYNDFLVFADKHLSIRKGGDDCSMYGGKCSAGYNNFYFSKSNIYLCGNCMDVSPIASSDTSFFNLESNRLFVNSDTCRKTLFKSSFFPNS